ncbi:conidiation protein 6 [Xylona heveae TC161]|uniref:Conidiation protein 6 n=1 Tax=Xylona heveae (strain CBS 132557 / TC161) TaxID=1328760 RepID=A0A165HY51_XYLHT|nr:conidiation protein 6 [Xylona heveae TC161]KZF24089.1 conidiation protein 6 [Xylona heveae TC161]
MSTGNIVGGHKATLNNPNVSEDAKQHSRQVLDDEFQGGQYESPQDGQKNPGNFAGGLKATLNNPKVSDEAKHSAQDRLNNTEFGDQRTVA